MLTIVKKIMILAILKEHLEAHFFLIKIDMEHLPLCFMLIQKRL